MLSYYYDCYKGTTAYNDATSMPVILENGKKVFGPPQKYYGPRPSHVCELYVTRIPPQLDELGFLVWLHRIGQVYAFRLMMDTGNTTRGYAFVRFCSERDALAAFELLKYLFVDGERLSVFRSQGKNRLFISGIPRQLPICSLEDGFKLCFPSMQSCTVYPAIKSKVIPGREYEENRGFAFIEFEDHEVALAAKKRLNTGRIGMWGADLKIQWAKPKEEMPAFPKFQEGTIGSGQNSLMSKQNDYCAKLRLNCLANNLCIPVILYGSCLRLFKLQYAGVLIKNSFTGHYCYFLLEIEVDKISDVHLIICEVAFKILEERNGELRDNVIIRVINDTKAELVYTFKNNDELRKLNLQNQIKYSNVLFELATSLQILGLQNHEKLLSLYKRSFLTHQPVATFCLDVKNCLTQFCAVLPKFRNNTKLNNNFNDFEIILLKSLSLEPNEDIMEIASPNQFTDKITTEPHLETQHLRSHDLNKCKYLTLKSQHGGFGIKYVVRYVDIRSVELRECYHSDQRVNSNPIWIAGHSYQQSIYN